MHNQGTFLIFRGVLGNHLVSLNGMISFIGPRALLSRGQLALKVYVRK
jgi:hypothetical protein